LSFAEGPLAGRNQIAVAGDDLNPSLAHFSQHSADRRPAASEPWHTDNNRREAKNKSWSISRIAVAAFAKLLSLRRRKYAFAKTERGSAWRFLSTFMSPRPRDGL
jgi:hypothetical protein